MTTSFLRKIALATATVAPLLAAAQASAASITYARDTSLGATPAPSPYGSYGTVTFASR